jgi:hypothetical protein
MARGFIHLLKRRIIYLLLFLLPISEDFNIVHTVGGRKLWELKGERVSTEEKKMLLSKIELTLYAHPIKKINALKAEYLGKECLMRENVKVSFKDGTKLLTPSLRWDGHTHSFFAEKDALILREGISISAKSLAVKEDGTLLLSSPSAEGVLRLFAKRAKILMGKERMELEGSVRVSIKGFFFEAESMRIMGPLSAPKMIEGEGKVSFKKNGFFAKGDSFSYKMREEECLIKGNVWMKSKDIVGECGRLQMLKEELILEENPKIEKEHLQIQGSIIKIGKERISVEGNVCAKIKIE